MQLEVNRPVVDGECALARVTGRTSPLGSRLSTVAKLVDLEVQRGQPLMGGLGLDDYGSDSDADNDVRPSSPPALKPLPTSKSSLSLPPPSNPEKLSTNPSAKPKRPPKKITINLPALPAESGDDVDKPPAKKPRLQSGAAGSSSLLSMLPPPKQALPTPSEAAPPSERVLGSGQRPSLVFNASKQPAENTASEASDRDRELEQATVDFFSLGSRPS